MAKRINSIICFLVIVGFCCVTVSPAHAGFAEDWITSKTATGGSTFEGQQRNYMYGGSVGARWRSTADPILSISLPKVSSGCGNIDLFAGGFSFLGFDYLVAKFQNMIMNAPAILFDVALKALAEQLSGSMKSLEQIVDTINGLQLDDCGTTKTMLAKAGISQAVNGFVKGAVKDPSSLQGVLSSVKESVGDVSSWFNSNEMATSSSGNVSVKNIEDAISGCSEATRSNLFMNGLGGSFLESFLVNGYGLNATDDAATIGLFRGIIGDVYIAPTVQGLDAILIDSCSENSKIDSIDDIKEGAVWIRSTAPAPKGTCTPLTEDIDFNQRALDVIQLIRNNYLNKQAFDATAVNLINSLPSQVNLLSTIKFYLMYGNYDALELHLQDVVATGLVYGFFVDLYDRIQSAIDRARTDAATKFSVTGRPELCQSVFVEQISSKASVLAERSFQQAELMHASFKSKESHLLQGFEVMTDMEDFRKIIENDVKKLFDPGRKQ
ncbi:MAG: conjugal transfer protein TraH [Desulfuromonadales bacterium]|nr:conjugal transfer protein TraH [Desulfuromonadales bacterium]MBN2793247.1 conjugal transfer protein TraH [Desulfuromonadales bacterium]